MRKLNNIFISNRCEKICDEDGDQPHTNGGAVYAQNCFIAYNKFSDNYCLSKVTYISGEFVFAHTKGGAVYAQNSSITDCEFINNYCKAIATISCWGDAQTGAYAFGGAVYSAGSTMSGNYFAGNSSQSLAFAGADDGGSADATSKSYGGAVYGLDKIENCIFNGNHASSSACAIDELYGYHEEAVSEAHGGATANVNCYNCLILMNNCYSTASASNSTSCSYGGGCYGGFVGNCTLLANSAGGNGDIKGGGIFNSTVRNCIVRLNTPDQFFDGNITYSNIQGGFSGTGNIDLDPCFVGGGEHPYSILPNSPCVDAGDPATLPSSLPELDLMGYPRFNDGDENGSVIVDMGAYEFNPPTLYADFHASQCQMEPLTEIQFFEDVWEINTMCESYQWDFNLDGIIDSEDPNPLFAYTETGVYRVKLIVKDTSGLISDTAIKSKYITVSDLHAGFYADQTYGTIPLTVHFTDTSSTEYTEISSWQWDFNNDGTFDAFGQNPEWTYNEPGIWSVKLVITDTSGYITETLLKENYIETQLSGTDEINLSTGLLEVFPNPFSRELHIRCSGDVYGSMITIRDTRGRIIRRLRMEESPAGTCDIVWDGTDIAGQWPGNGLYLVCLEKEGKVTSVRKVLLLN